MTWKNNLPETTQVSFYEMCLRVTVKLKASYLVSKTENSLAQAAQDNIIIHKPVPRSQSYWSKNRWAGLHFCYQYKKKNTSMTSAARVNMLYCSQEELKFLAYNHFL